MASFTRLVGHETTCSCHARLVAPVLLAQEASKSMHARLLPCTVHLLVTKKLRLRLHYRIDTRSVEHETELLLLLGVRACTLYFCVFEN